MLSERLAPRPHGFDAWLESLAEDHRTVVLGWLRDTTFSATAIARALREDEPAIGYVGYKGNHDTIQRWRRDNGIV